MIDEDATKREARISAIEFMIAEAFSALYRGLPPQAIHDRHDALCAGLAKRAVSGVDPALSDLYSAEAEDALRELTRLIETYIGAPRPKAAEKKRRKPQN